MEKRNQYSLVLLAGGKSSRMGKNKAELTINGKTFVEILLNKAKALGISQIFLSGFEVKDSEITVVQDIFKERGPLGGIHACMRQMTTPYCFVVPVDVPQIPLSMLQRLMEAHEGMEDRNKPVVLKHGERRENLIGIYPIRMADYIEKLSREHSASVHGILESWGHEGCEVEIPDWQAENINTWDTYTDILKMIETGID